MSDSDHDDSDRFIHARWVEERTHVENVLMQRFNYFIVFFGVVLAGAVATPSDFLRAVLLWIGFLVSVPIILTLKRSDDKLDIALDHLYGIENDPSSIIDDKANERGRSQRRWIGRYIPAGCAIILFAGAIGATMSPIARLLPLGATETETGHLESSWLGVIAAIVSAAAAIGAVSAAFYANKGANATRRAQTFVALDNRYHSLEMGNALGVLREMWPRNSGPLDGDDWLRRIDAPTTPEDEAKADERRVAIRHVKSYFFSAAHLIRFGGPEGEAAGLAAFRYGVELFFQVVLPIEKSRRTEQWPFETIYQEVTRRGEYLLMERINLKISELRRWDDDARN